MSVEAILEVRGCEQIICKTFPIIITVGTLPLGNGSPEAGGESEEAGVQERRLERAMKPKTSEEWILLGVRDAVSL